MNKIFRQYIAPGGSETLEIMYLRPLVYGQYERIDIHSDHDDLPIYNLIEFEDSWEERLTPFKLELIYDD